MSDSLYDLQYRNTYSRRQRHTWPAVRSAARPTQWCRYRAVGRRSALQATQDPIRFDAPVGAACELLVLAIAELAAIREVRHPGLTLGGARGRPRREADV